MIASNYHQKRNLKQSICMASYKALVVYKKKLLIEMSSRKWIPKVPRLDSSATHKSLQIEAKFSIHFLSLDKRSQFFIIATAHSMCLHGFFSTPTPTHSHTHPATSVYSGWQDERWNNSLWLSDFRTRYINSKIISLNLEPADEKSNEKPHQCTFPHSQAMLAYVPVRKLLPKKRVDLQIFFYLL